jgi:hypothetical protein
LVELSKTLEYINLVGVDIGLVVLCGPMYLCVCVSEKRGDGEEVGSYTPSDTLGYINLVCFNLTGLCGELEQNLFVMNHGSER